MSFAEIKERVKELTPQEREELALHIEFLRRVSDPEWGAEMERRAEEAAGGGKLVPMKEVQALHDRLLAEGR